MRKIFSALTLMVTLVSWAQAPAGYYDLAQGKSGDELKASLNTIIKGHTEFPYTSSSTDTWDVLKEADTDPNNSNNVIGIYSGFSMDGEAEYDNGNGWTREHVWAKSRGDFGTDRGAGTDLHHLRAEDASTNSARSNRNFDEASTQYVDGSGQYSGTTQSYTGGSSNFTWEPPEVVKGDVARMLFYMATRYEGEGDEPDLELTEELLDPSDKSPLHARLSVLLVWHNDDPVDATEENRNDIIYSYQGNRNPFIDHPEYVGLIWGGASIPPAFESTPINGAQVGTEYVYSITTSGGNGAVSLSSNTIPDWLELTDNGDGTGALQGTPDSDDQGEHSVSLEVTDGQSTDTQSFNITVTLSETGSSSDLLFSEYIEGTSFNKALEIANFTGEAVSLENYVLKKQTNGGGDWSSGLNLSGTINDGDVYVLSHSSADASILQVADFTGGNSELNFNGNDALGLFNNETLIDLIGVFGNSEDYAKDVTLVRKPEITSPNSTYTSSEWDSYNADEFSYLGSHVMNTGSSNRSPNVSFSAPQNGSSFTKGTTFTIAVTADDTDGNIALVEFFVNGNSIGTDTTSPFGLNWTIGEGLYSLTAVATDNKGATTTSTAVSVTGELATVLGFEDGKTPLVVFPNPFNDQLNLSNEQKFTGQFRLTTLEGKIIVNKNVTMEKGTYSLEIPNMSLEDGIYILKIITGDAEYITRLIKR